jgi:hypothetical protein
MIVTEAHAVGMSAVLDAQGRGPNTFTGGRQLVAAGTTAPVVARLTHDGNGTTELETEWRAMSNDKDLPKIEGSWGENGVISSLDAENAMGGLTVYSVGGIKETTSEWISGILSGRGLAFKPQGGG